MAPYRTPHKASGALATRCGDLPQPAGFQGLFYGLEYVARWLSVSHCWRATSAVAFNLATVAGSS